MIQEKMNILEQVGLSESNLSDKAVTASFHSRVSFCTRVEIHVSARWVFKKH